MFHDRPTLTPAQLTVDTATLVRERAGLRRLALDGRTTLETAAPRNLVSLLRNTLEGRGYRLHSNTVPPDSTDETFAGSICAEAIRTETITLRERFVPESIRLLAGLLAATAGGIALALVAVEFALVALMLAGFAIASPSVDSRTPATVTYPVQLELSVSSEPLDTPPDPSLPTDSRFAGRPTPLAVTVDIVSYAPFDGVPESELRDDVDAVTEALREFDDA